MSKSSLCLWKMQQILSAALGIYLIILLLAYPALSLEYAAKGLKLWFDKMIPTLLPFMILSGIMIRMNLTHKCVRVFHPLFGCLYGTSPNGTYTILMGFLCGFPMGARIVGELLEAGRITRKEGNLLLAFCNNIGPIYFLSFVVPMLGIQRPFVPFCIMYGVPLLYGMAVMRIQHADFKIVSPENPVRQGQSMPLLAALDASVISGLIGIAKLGGYMVFFNLLNIVFVPFTNLPSLLLHFYNCILEITSGIDRCGHFNPYMVLILLPFGGFSCFAQTYSMIRHTDLSLRPYLFHKIIQTAITALCYFLWRPY